MTDPTYRTSTETAAGAESFDEGLRQHMLRVYGLMSGALAVTGLVAALVAGTPALYEAILGTPLFWVAALAPLGFVFFLSLRIDKISLATANLVFWVYAAVMGLSMSFLFLAYTEASVAKAFLVTAGSFAALSLYGYTTRRSLSGLGTFLYMGLVGLIIAMVVNMFLASAAMDFVISVVGVLIFSGLTAYDTQKIKESYSEHHGAETSGKLAVMGALSLYLDFVNLFSFILSFLGERE